MSLAGRLETLDLAGILQTLAVGTATGRLTLTRLDSHAVLVLRRGRIVYTAGASAPETLAARLLRLGLVGEADMLDALRRQHEGDSPRRLAEVIADMGLLAGGTLQAVVRSYMQELVAELLAWKTGYFRFEPALDPDAPVPEVDLGDFVLPGGLAPQELLMRAATAIDSGTMPPMRRPRGLAAAGRPGGAGRARGQPRGGHGAGADRLLPGRLHGRGGPVAPEVRLAAPHAGGRVRDRRALRPRRRRVRRHAAAGSPRRRARDGRVAARAVDRPRRRRAAPTYVGPLEPTAVNLALAERLGASEVGAAVAIPLVVRGEVRFVLYGDNALDGRPIGPLDALESAAASAARVIEKTLDARDRESPA